MRLETRQIHDFATTRARATSRFRLPLVADAPPLSHFGSVRCPAFSAEGPSFSLFGRRLACSPQASRSATKRRATLRALELSAEAFGPGRFARTAYRVREGVAPVARLSLTGWLDGRLVGGIRFTAVTHRRRRGGASAWAAGGRSRRIRATAMARRWSGRGSTAHARKASPRGAGRRHALLRPLRLRARAARTDHAAGARGSGAAARAGAGAGCARRAPWGKCRLFAS